MRVAVCTMYSESHIGLAEICVPNLKKYCEKHGYEFYEIRIENDKYFYEKHYDFHQLFESGVDLIFYCDVDTVLTNHTKKIENFIDDEHDVFITRDFNELNGGSVIWKGTEWGKKINLHIIAEKENWPNEQNCINYYWDKPEWGGRVKILDHPSINGYDYSLYFECKDYIGREDLGDWKPGNFLIHFPALSPENKKAMMQEYKDKIIYE